MTAHPFCKSRVVFLLTCVWLANGFFFPVSAFAETLYVKRSGTKLRDAASARAPVVRILGIGAPVEVLKKSRIFYQVKLPEGDTGWVYKFKLSPQAPVDPAFDPGLWGVLGNGPVIAAKEADSGSMIRGLKPLLDEKAVQSGASGADIQAVEAMEVPQVTPEELDAFLSARGLGPYQKAEGNAN